MNIEQAKRLSTLTPPVSSCLAAVPPVLAPLDSGIAICQSLTQMCGRG